MWEGSMWWPSECSPCSFGGGPGRGSCKNAGGHASRRFPKDTNSPPTLPHLHCPPCAMGNSQARNHQHLGSGWAPSQNGCARCPCLHLRSLLCTTRGQLSLPGSSEDQRVPRAWRTEGAQRLWGISPLPRARIAGADHQPGEPMLIPTVHSNWNRLPSGRLTR